MGGRGLILSRDREAERHLSRCGICARRLFGPSLRRRHHVAGIASSNCARPPA
jgi:hypothetical protein